MEYIIRAGDNLIRIAKAFGVTVEAILKMNPDILNPHNILSGDLLRIPIPHSDTLDEPAWLTAAYDEIHSDRHAASYGFPNPRISLYKNSPPNDMRSWNAAFVYWCLSQSNHVGADEWEPDPWRTWGEKLENSRLGCIVLFERAEDTQGTVRIGFHINELASRTEILAGDIGGHIHVIQVEKNRVSACRWPSPDTAVETMPAVP